MRETGSADAAHAEAVEAYDLLVVGGGINGTAVARDAAGRGLSVLLAERDDLASHTSSASTKLIHGGLRYPEQYEFRLVRESLKEREVMLRAAPHIIWPMRFVLPYDQGLRPKWMLRAGLFLYDHLGGRELLPGTKGADLTEPPHAGFLEPRLRTGFEYSDCWVEDARLVVLNAVDAAARGARIETRTEVHDLETIPGGYRATLRPEGGAPRAVTARAVVNTAGAWVEDVVRRIDHGRNRTALRLVKGSHIVTRRLYEGEHAYIFQNGDGRVIFAIPYETDFTLIGTTDVPYDPAEGPVVCSDEEIAYLCSAVNEYLAQDIAPSDVVWTYSGVRPLYDDQAEDASAVTRDYVLNLEAFGEAGAAPFLTVYGGKITTSRKLAEHAMEKILPAFPDAGGDWTRGASLPGGDIPGAAFEEFLSDLLRAHPNEDARLVRRLARAYGTRARGLLAGGLGRVFAAGLSEGEMRMLAAEEWARSADDVLWRRTKLGLHMTEAERAEVAAWWADFAGVRAAS